jgi:hypothetical protein
MSATSSGCEEFARLAVSDEEDERRAAAAHAALCPACAEVWRGWEELRQEAARWRDRAPAPSPILERRVRRAARGGRRWRGWRLGAGLAAAAAVLASAALLLRLEDLGTGRAGPSSSSGALLAERALREADAAERAHARAIARLEAAAAARLERAADPSLPAQEAALLLAYRDRLRFLDRSLAEVQGYLAENPYHAKARALLLAGYTEKSDVLRQVLALELGGAT